MIIFNETIDERVSNIKNAMNRTNWKLYRDPSRCLTTAYDVYAVAVTNDGNNLCLVWEKTNNGYLLTAIQALGNSTGAGEYGHNVIAKSDNIREGVMRFNLLNQTISQIRYGITKDGNHFVA